eukprot:scaffold98354_cov35-Tisochrysis_lutea.AAC.2
MSATSRIALSLVRSVSHSYQCPTSLASLSGAQATVWEAIRKHRRPYERGAHSVAHKRIEAAAAALSVEGVNR